MMELMTTCGECGAELQIGDWPYCPHGSIHEQNAQHFDPIVVHRDADGAYSFPASVDAPIRPGYERVEIRTLREADRLTREVNSHEDARIREAHYQSEATRDQSRRRNREVLDRLKRRFSPAGLEFADGARRYVDQKPSRPPGSANFHIDVFAHDASNRELHADERTGWQRRKA